MTALIVLGVIAFLALDAYIIYRVVRSHRGAGDYASISVPGETTVTLGAGKVKLTYQESERARGDEDHIYFEVPSELQVEVVGGSRGEPLEIKGPGFGGMGSSKSTGPGFSRSVIGTVEISEPGVYTVSARPELPGAVAPTVLVGK